MRHLLHDNISEEAKFRRSCAGTAATLEVSGDVITAAHLIRDYRQLTLQEIPNLSDKTQNLPEFFSWS